MDIPGDIALLGGSQIALIEQAVEDAENMFPPPLTVHQRVRGERVVLEVPHCAILSAYLRTFPGALYDEHRRSWSVPRVLGDVAVEGISGLPLQVTFSPASLCYTPTRATFCPDRLPELSKTLFPHQLDGLRSIVERGGRALLADEMGLGKTLQAIAFAFYYRAAWPLLVVVPGSLRSTWQEQFEKWAPSVEFQLNVVWSKTGHLQGSINILSYDNVAAFQDELALMHFQVVVLDESHFIKNGRAKRTKLLMPILKRARRVLLLSGTPSLARPKELFCQLHAIDPLLWASYSKYVERYCGGPDRYGRCNGASNLDELSAILARTVMVRRTKAEVFTELPSKFRTVRWVAKQGVAVEKLSDLRREMWAMDEGLRHEELMVGRISDESRNARFALMSQMYFWSGMAKAHGTIARVAELLEDRGRKVIVVAHHAAVIEQICATLQEKDVQHVRLDGTTPARMRSKHVKRFQNDPWCLAAVISLNTAGMGITLSAAATVVMAELHWTPGLLLQAEDRAHRIGQSFPVNIEYILAHNSIDDIVWPMMQKKLGTLKKTGLSAGKIRVEDELKYDNFAPIDVANLPSPGAWKDSDDDDTQSSEEGDTVLFCSDPGDGDFRETPKKIIRKKKTKKKKAKSRTHPKTKRKRPLTPGKGGKKRRVVGSGGSGSS